MSLQEVFSYEAFVHAIAGTAGGSTAMTVFYPLDVIRTYMQVEHRHNSTMVATLDIIKEEGLEALYKGLQGTLISLGVSNFVYFYSNNLFKVLIRRATGKDVTVVQNLLVASMAGVINVLLTCPLWVANTRMKLQKKKDPNYDTGMWSTMKKISKDEGFWGLWSGAYASLLLVSNPTIHFVVYDKVFSIVLKRVQESGRKGLNSWEIFVVGAIAKAAATFLTYPIQMAQTRLRSHGHSKEGDKNSQKYKDTMDVLIKVFQSHGILGWFTGLNVKLLQTVLTAAFQFLCYEHIKNVIFKVLGPKK
eukprot:TRINITY_DN3123_c0_g1_i1.p1 TRINITY_DN3123_c0_g1~~TRINITY_DN3123_c0_g1_i1.p1  ORF type:complete len:304 (-),score=73.18 TRINITY_DN3123_c0_g1_i1:129-1040(-)